MIGYVTLGTSKYEEAANFRGLNGNKLNAFCMLEEDL